MSNLDVIRAWKDPEYRMGLSATDRALLPAHPAGLIEMSGAQLETVQGGYGVVVTIGLGVIGSLIASCIWDSEKCEEKLYGIARALAPLGDALANSPLYTPGKI